MLVKDPPRFLCGIDWSEHLNEVAVIDRTGGVVARHRAASTPQGVRDLLALLAGLRTSHTHSRRHVPVAIETTRGPLIAALRARQHPVYPVPPAAVAAFRHRISPGRKKSDRTDAELLALILRDEWGRLRPLPDSSPIAEAVTVLADAQRRARATPQRLQAQLRAVLGQAHPQAVTAWAKLDGGLTRPQARAVLAAAPTAAAAQRLAPYQLAKILTTAGRTRLVDQEAYRLHDLFAEPVLRLPPPVEQAMAIEVRAALSMFDHACTTTDQLTTELDTAFHQHPTAATYLSFPGCGPLIAARLLAEIGGDPQRFGTARGLCAYAGLLPVTWASGNSHQVRHRQICSRRLKTTCHQWAFAALTRSPGCRALYDRRRHAGDSYAGALRRVAARLLTGLHHCLATGHTYDEHAAFTARPDRP